MAVPTIQITGSVVAPDGSLLTSGIITAELSQPGSVLDGAVSVRVVGKISGTITAGAVPADFDLVPNASITPAGTYYRVTIEGRTADGEHYRSAPPEKWQLAASPSSVDIGAVPRLSVVPGVALGLPLATASVPGAVQLTGDLGGTAASPTVPGLAGRVSSAGGDVSDCVATPTGGVSGTIANHLAAALAGGGGGASALTFYDPCARLSPFTHPGSGLVLSAARGTRAAFFDGDRIVEAPSNAARVDARGGLVVERAGSSVLPMAAEQWQTPYANVLNTPTLQLPRWELDTGNTTVVFRAPGALGGLDGARIKASAANGRIALALGTGLPAGQYTASAYATAAPLAASTFVGIAVPEIGIYDATTASYVARTEDRCVGEETRRLSVTWTVVAGHDYYLNLFPERNGSARIGAVYWSHVQIDSGPCAKSPLRWSERRGRDIVTTPAADALKVPAGSGFLRLTPWWSSANATTDRIVLESTGFELRYVAASSAWRLTVGGQVVTAPSYAFAAETERYLRWRYTVGGKAYLSADWQAEAESAGNVVAFTPSGVLYLGGGAADAADVMIHDLFFDAASTVRAWAAPKNDDIAICVGDSITNGAQHLTAYPRTLSLSTGRRVINWGFGWATTADMLARWRSENRGQGAAALSILGGINDVIADASAATIEANLDALITEALADGLRVAVMTILPFRGYTGWSAPRQAVLEAVNTWIRARAGITVIDTYADMGDPGGGGADYMLPAYRAADYLHTVQAGSDRIAVLVGAWLGNAS